MAPPDTYLARVVVEGGRPAARAIFHPELVAAVQAGDGLAPGDVALIERGARRRVARAGTARARLYDLLERHGIDPIHSPPVLAETARVLAHPGLDDATVDRTALPFCTIDNADSRDLDQALCIERGPGGGWLLHYALADAAYYVRPGGALFEDGLARGTSYYLPGLSAPMLPPALSEGLVSLNPVVERRALLFSIHLDAAGAPTRTEVARARVRSRAKLSYDGVQAYHDRKAGHPLAGHDYTESLDLLREVGEVRIAAARARGVVDFNRKSLEVELTDDDRELRGVLRGRNDVERWNEQVSLLCNMEGARLFLGGGAHEDDAQPIFRTHPAPPPEAMAKAGRLIDALVREHRLDPAVWRWRREQGEDLSAYLRRLPKDEATARVRDGIERQVLYANQPSLFTSGAGPHHALGVTAYARFTAPMREIVGIFTHKEGLERLGLLAPGEPSADAALRERAIDAGNRAKRRQNELTKDVHELVIDRLFEGDLALPEAERPARRGTILGVAPGRMFVELDDFPIELKVYRPDLEAAWGPFEPSRDGTSLVFSRPGAPRLRVGDAVGLRTVGHADGHWQLRPSPVT